MAPVRTRDGREVPAHSAEYLAEMRGRTRDMGLVTSEEKLVHYESIREMAAARKTELQQELENKKPKKKKAKAPKFTGVELSEENVGHFSRHF